MADCMKLAEKELYTLLLESVGRAVAAGTLPAEPMNTFKIEVPADKSHGDFAANIAMVNAKAFRMPPRKIAEAIFNELQLQGSSFEKAEIAGPGFMNFFLKRQWFSKTVQTEQASGFWWNLYLPTQQARCMSEMQEAVHWATALQKS